MTEHAGIDLTLFKESLDRNNPPKELGLALQALWHQARGDWKEAHRLAQAQDDQNCAWVHGYLHRVDGNDARAGKWYRRADRSQSSAPLEKEWEEIVSMLLRNQGQIANAE